MKQQEYEFSKGHYRMDKASQTLWIQDRVGWRSFWREATKEEIGGFLVDFLQTMSLLTFEPEVGTKWIENDVFKTLNLSVLERSVWVESGKPILYLAIGNRQFAFHFRCYQNESMVEVQLLSEPESRQRVKKSC